MMKQTFSLSLSLSLSALFSVLFVLLLLQGCVSGTEEAVQQAASQITAGGGGGTTTPDGNTISILPISEITLLAGKNELIADGSDKALIRAVVKDTTGAAKQDVTVTFSTTAGVLSAGSVVTNESGIAEVYLTSGGYPAVATVRADAGGFGAKTTIKIVTEPGSIELNLSENQINTAGMSTLWATVSDNAGNAVSDIEVQFFIETNQSGASLSSASAITDGNGVATVTYFAGETGGVVDSVIAVVPSRGLRITSPKVIEVGSLTADQVNVNSLVLWAGKEQLTVGGDTTTIRATVTDAVGNAVNGAKVNFSSGSVAALSANSAITNVNGVAEVTLSSRDVAGAVTLSAEYRGIGSAINLNIVAAEATSLVLTASSAALETAETTQIKAKLLDEFGNPVSGESIVFDLVGKGQLGGDSATTGANGIATISFTADAALTGTTTINAVSATNVGLKGSVTVTVSTPPEEADEVIRAAELTIATDKVAVLSDGNDRATLTVTAKNSEGAVLPGVIVTFATTGGELSHAQLTTDDSGKAQVTFAANLAEPANQTETITATASGVTGGTSIPIRITGSSVTISSDRTNLVTGGADTAEIDLLASNGAGTGVFNADIELSLSDPDGDGAGGTLLLNGNPLDGNTIKSGVDGRATVRVKGINAGVLRLTAKSLGDTKTFDFNVQAAAQALQITAPITEAEKIANLDQSVTVKVSVPTTISGKLVFVTTHGQWSNGNKQIEVDIAATEVSAILSSGNANGVATVSVFAKSNITLKDSVQIKFVNADVAVGSSVTIQATPTTLQPSGGDAQNSARLTGMVRDANGAPIYNALVHFTLENSTGGGEYVEDAYVYSDSSGQVTTNFISGSISSDATGVRIKAALYGTNGEVDSDVVSILINQTAGSVVIGSGNLVATANNDTSYELPMAIMVSDSAGNPVANTTVTLKSWPIFAYTGYRVTLDEICPAVKTYAIPNEDSNRNLSLDDGEDKSYPESSLGVDFNFDGDLQDIIGRDGLITPQNSSGGSVPVTVRTDESGVATFTISYLKQYASWIETEIEASVVVQGTENTGRLRMTLPPVAGDTCSLDNSPFNPPSGSGPSLSGEGVTLSAATSETVVNGDVGLTATVTDIQGNAVRGANVDFTLSVQSSSGAASGQLSAAQATTNGAGKATVTYTAGGVVGTEVVTATVAGYDYPASQNITILAEGVSNIADLRLTAASTTVVADGSDGTIVRAQLLDSDFQPVIGREVAFVTSFGRFDNADDVDGDNNSRTITVVSGSGGIASARLTGPNPVGIGLATVKATAGDYEDTVQVNFTAGEAATINLTPLPSAVNTGGNSQIAVRVTDGNGLPVANQTLLVTFTNNSGGSVSPILAETNSSGQLTINYVAGIIAVTDTITVTSSSNSGVTASLDIVVTRLDVNSINLISGSSNVTADGAGSTAITATVRDVNGAVVAGATVNFSTTLGTLSPDAATVGTVTTLSATSNSNGVARVFLFSTTSAGTAAVSANAEGSIASVNVSFVSGSANGIVLNTDKAVITQADSVNFSGFIRDANNNILSNAEYTLDVVDNFGAASPNYYYTRSGRSDANGAYSDGGWVVPATLADTVQVRVRSGTAISSVRTLTTVGSITVASASATMTADGSSTNAVTVNVKGMSGGNVSGVPVGICSGLEGTTFTASGNTIAQDCSSVTTSTANSYSGNLSSSTFDNPFSVNVDGTAVAVRYSFTNVPENSWLDVDLYNLDTNQIIRSNFISTLVNDGQPILNGLAVTPQLSRGSYYFVVEVNNGPANWSLDVQASTATTTNTDPTTTLQTDASGNVSVTLNSGNKAGTAAISAYAHSNGTRNNSATTDVILTAGAPSVSHGSYIVSAAPSTVNGSGSSQVSVKVVDSNGNAVSGETITFSISTNTSGANLSATTAVTGNDGIATVAYTAGTTEGADTITTVASSNDATKTGTITVDNDAVVVGGVAMATGSNSLTANGTSSTILRVTVRDTAGAVVPSATVTFSTTLGTLSSNSVTTNSSGIAEATLTSVAILGTANITATSNGFITRSSVQFVTGAVDTVAVSGAPSTVNPSGTSTVSATVTDANGLFITGETVTFRISTNNSGGTIATTGTTNANGVATAVYTAGSSNGTDTITAVASSNSTSGTANIVVNAAAQVVGSVSASSGATSLTANGTSTTTIRATVRDTAGAVVPNTSVSFSTTLGTLSSASGTTDSSGVAEVMLTSVTTLGTATVTATSNGFAATTSVQFIADSTTGSIVLSPAGPITVSSSSSTTFTVTSTDVNANPVIGESLRIQLTTNGSGGSVSAITGTTDSNGQFSFTYTAGSGTGSDVIAVSSVTNSSRRAAPVAITVNQTTVTPASLILVTDKTTLTTGTTETATISAYVRGAGNNLLSNIPVTFTSDSGTILVNNGGVSDSNGVATAQLNVLGGDINRPIEVTATTGSISERITINATGTTITISGLNSVNQDTPLTLTARLANGAGNPVSGQTLTISSANNNPLSSTTGTTGSNGSLAIQVTPTVVGTDTITITGAGATATHALNVTGTTVFSLSSTNTDINLGETEAITLTWTEAGVGQAGQTINFSSTRGVLDDPSDETENTAVTDGTGVAKINISSTSAGVATITAISTTGLSAELTREFVATTPTSINVQASKVLVGTGGEQSSITATVRDANNNLVKSQVVLFTLNDVSGGTINLSTGITDSLGRVSTVYTSSSVSSAQNGVTVQATLRDNSAITDTVNLTVSQQPLFIRFGTGNQVGTPNASTLTKTFTLLVTDAAGAAVANQAVALSAKPLSTAYSAYSKGFWQTVDTTNPPDGTPDEWQQVTEFVCTNEDANLNGILDSGEDVNLSGQLEPGNVVTIPASVTTGSDGTATFDITYARNFAHWAAIEITASSTVAGTESSYSQTFSLPGLASDYTNPNVSPPGATSPFGRSTSTNCITPNSFNLVAAPISITVTATGSQTSLMLLTDSSGNPVSGQPLTYSETEDGTMVISEDAACTTAANGTCTATINVTNIGASGDSSQATFSHSGASATVTITNGN
ncbi:hypothetical protein D5085_08555 [Ectothiorhodospiraceae bacterium BW-2]|nr:hypothetical protein D5085_08555 [Ectothiorhodospiraceae bacterium BW-2]